MPSDSLTRKQMDAIAALLAGRSQREAAKQAGCDPKTLRRWLSSNQAFKEELEISKRNTYELLVSGLVGRSEGAINTLSEICENQSEKASDRVAAARIILTLAMRGILSEEFNHAVAVARKYGVELKDTYLREEFSLEQN